MTDKQQECTQQVAKENLAAKLKDYKPGTQVLLDIKNVPREKKQETLV